MCCLLFSLIKLSALLIEKSMPKPKCISYLFYVGFHLFFVYFLVLTFTPRMCSIKCHFLSTPFYQGFWVVSTSEDEVSELKSYESGGNESSENEEISKEESEEVSEEEESVNDVEVMEILEQAEAHKQDQSKMQLEPVSMDKSDNINNVKVDNLRIETTSNSANESEKKVCI